MLDTPEHPGQWSILQHERDATLSLFDNDPVGIPLVLRNRVGGSCRSKSYVASDKQGEKLVTEPYGSQEAASTTLKSR
jgi:hypothetical protein